jgi:protein O-GlcNAc transferase
MLLPIAMPLPCSDASARRGVSVAAFLVCCIACGAQESSSSLKQADADYRAGVAAMSRNDLRTARIDFEHVVRLEPGVEEGHSALGAVLVRSGETASGIRELEKALAMRADDATAEQYLAIAFEESGQAARSLPLFAKLETAARSGKQPLSAEFLAAYARALAAADQSAAARSEMKEALDEAPQSAELWDELGTLEAQQKDWREAEQAFSHALLLDSNLAMAHLHLGLTLQAEQRPGAQEEVRKANTLAPNNAVITLELAKMLAGAGNDREAIPLLQHAVALDPGSEAASYQLAVVLQRTGQVDEAIPLLEKAAAADHADSDVLTNLGMALCQVQRAKDAVPVLQKAVSLAPRNAVAHEDLAAAYIQLNQLDDAVKQLREALQLNPDSEQLHYNLGLALKMQDDAADAIPEFETAEKQDPTAPEPPYALGLLYLQAGRYADAERELTASLRVQPQNGDGWATLGSVENHLDKLPEAANALQEAIRQRPDQPDPYLTLGAVLVKQNQPEQAAAQRRKAAELMRINMNRQRAEVSCNSGNDLLKEGKVADAVAAFRDAVSFDPGDAQAHLGLANALEEQGETAEAALERQKARSLETASSADTRHN